MERAWRGVGWATWRLIDLKTGFSTFACPTWDFIQVVDVAAKMGFDGVEFRCDALHAHRVEAWSVLSERKEFRRLLTKRGVEICCLATSLQMIERDVMDALTERIELAHELDCPRVRVFGGPVPDGVSRAIYHSDLVDQLRRAADIAEEFNVALVLETHDGLSRASDVAAVLRELEHPKLKVLYDPIHPLRSGESVSATFSAMGDLLDHCHMHDGLVDPNQVVVCRMGQGQLPLTEIIDWLQTAQYQGYVVGEWFYEEYGLTPEESLEAYLDDLRQYKLIHSGPE